METSRSRPLQLEHPRTISAVTTSRRSVPLHNGPPVSADHGLGAGVITGDCRGHVCDQDLRAAVDDCQQLLADLAGVRQVEYPPEASRPPACPPTAHRVDVLKHRSGPSRRVGAGA